jgi:5-methyltetrahydropteroyltriglutamate--homocysteine methyltransferase
MDLLTANHSGYPRIGSRPDEQVLRHAIAQRDRGEKTDADVRTAEDQLVLLALQDQEEAGLDVVTDGLIRWNDPISHLVSKLEGTCVDGLHRYFDTNSYFRRPVVCGKPARSRPLVLDEFQWAAQRSARQVKAVLTGPLTLARLSLQEFEPVDIASLVFPYADALSAEVAELTAAGARAIQIDEPCLAKYPSDLPFAREALALIAARKGNTELGLATYFGDAAPVYSKLQEFPFDTLVFDFTYSQNLQQVIEAEGSAKPLAFGLLDGRNTKIEDKTAVARRLERMLSRVTAERCYLTTSCGLEYLPRDRAQLKLRHLTSIKNLLLGERR